jgi:hypothetical protein
LYSLEGPFALAAGISHNDQCTYGIGIHQILT